MCERYPEDEESEKAREGTAAHWYVSETLFGRSVKVGDVAPNGVPIDAEMVDCGDVLIRHARSLPIGELLVEGRLRITSVHPTDCWGTVDVGHVLRDQRRLTIVDYKYGHRYVDAFRNWQLMLYAIGILDELGVSAEDRRYWTINLVIVQPRSYHPTGPIRTWTLGGPALLKYTEQLRRAATVAMLADAPLQTGPHCRDCSARHACPALHQAAALSVDVAHEQTPMELSPIALGLELRYLMAAEARIKARRDALEEMVLGMMRSGRDVPLFKADYSSGRRKWKLPAAQAAAMGDMFGVDLRKPLDVITPTQAEASGVPREIILQMSDQPRGSMKLVPVTDDTVARAFGDE